MRVLPLLTVLLVGCPSTHTYYDGSGLQGQLEREVIALQQSVRTLEYQLEICGEDGEPTEMFQELHSVFSSNRDVTVERQGTSTVVTLPADHLFSRGTDMRDEARMTIDILATAINLHPDHQITIEGHSDDTTLRGDLRRLYTNDWGLAYARAEAVMDLMITEFGVSERRFRLTSRGPFDPLATNDTEAGQAKNRRVVIYMKPTRRSR